jgi:hypothetical protein
VGSVIASDDRVTDELLGNEWPLIEVPGGAKADQIKATAK